MNSGYKVAKLCENKATGEESSSNRREGEDRKLWHGIWNMNIKKRSNTSFEKCYDRIPLNSNLRKMGIEVEEMCRLCGEGRKTVEYLFFHCNTAKLIWKLSPMDWEGIDHINCSFKEWWNKLENATDSKELLAYIIWHLWKQRNRWIFNAK